MEMDKKMDRALAETVLTVGCAYHPPKGGIAQVLFNYNKYIFPQFQHITDTLGKNNIKKFTVTSFAIIKTIFILLINKHIKIVHIHTASYHSFIRSSIFLNISHFFHKRIILHIHGGGFKNFYEKNPQFVKHQLEKVDAVIALSESWRTFFTKEVGLKNVHVVPNIVPPPHFLKASEHKTFNLLFLGFIYQKKGIFDLIDVIIQNKERYRGRLKLYIGGTGQEYARLIDSINENDINDIVNLCGWVSGDDKIKLLNIADAYILPSYAEGVPISILEAMSYGLPILSTPVGGIPEIVENGVNGFLFQPGDKKAMQNSIDKLINDSTLIKQMGTASLQRSKQYLPPKISDKLQNIYYALI